jgi:hypothetical protein
MDIKRSGSQSSGKGPAEYFTGTVRIDPLFEAPEPARVLVSRSSHVPARPGTLTRWVRPSLLPPGAASYRVGEARLERFGQAMSSGAHPARNIGTVRPRKPP